MESITFLYPHRNRDVKRIKKSMDSLASQKVKNFQVLFVDYGSENDVSEEIAQTVACYSFARCIFLETQNQIWSKSKALNFAIKHLTSEYCFVADVDIIFHPRFTSILDELKDEHHAVYFQVGFLTESQSNRECTFEDYEVKFISNSEATGMTLFPVEKLKEIRGFDEFFHFWGSEDTDVHNRFKLKGNKILFYCEKLLLLHQWHPNFNSKKSKNLTVEPQLSRISEINQLHQIQNLTLDSEVNIQGWGNISSSKDIEDKIADVKLMLSNEKKYVEYFLSYQLAHFAGKIIEVEIRQSEISKLFKYQLKRIIGKKVPEFYSLKEVNDQILLHIISFHRSKPYIYRVNENMKSIFFKIKP